MDFMTRDGEQIHAKFFYIDRHFPRRLNRIHMEIQVGAVFPHFLNQLSNLCNRLQRST